MDENSSRIVSSDPVLAPYRYNDIVHLFEGEQHTNGADASQPTVPPGPGTVSAVHPLLSRNNGDNVYSVNSASQSQFNSSILTRNFRSSRQRLHRSNQLPQGQSVASFNLVPPSAHPTLNPGRNWQPLLNNPLHPSGVHNPNQPVLLQRLLGPSNTQNLLQITRAAIQPRLVFSSNDYQLFTTSNWNDNNQIGPESNDGSMLSSIATAITRWIEESKVLDGDSIHDCVANLKPDIVAVWEKHRDEEMNERMEKRKEMIEKDRKNQEQARQQAEKEKQQQQTTTTTISPETNPPASSITTSSNSDSQQQPSSNISNISNENSSNQTEQQQSSSNQVAENVVESEQMEVVTTQQTSSSADEIQTSSTATSNQNDDLIEMTCSETISTEQEMEVTNPNETPEPNNTVEIPNNQQQNAISNEENATGSNEPQQGASNASAAEQQPSNSGNSKFNISCLACLIEFRFMMSRVVGSTPISCT